MHGTLSRKAGRTAFQHLSARHGYAGGCTRLPGSTMSSTFPCSHLGVRQLCLSALGLDRGQGQLQAGTQECAVSEGL
jgi:hypothetical protein